MSLNQVIPIHYQDLICNIKSQIGAPFEQIDLANHTCTIEQLEALKTQAVLILDVQKNRSFKSDRDLIEYRKICQKEQKNWNEWKEKE
jgi:hypothetical protein